MKKYKVIVEITVDDTASVPALLQELSSAYHNENDKGTLEKHDGDLMKWKTED